MSFEEDMKDVGDSIGRLVDHAVNSQDFQALSQKITDTVNQFVYPARKGPYRANSSTGRQNTASPVSNRSKEPLPASPYAKERENRRKLRERFSSPSQLSFLSGVQLIGGILITATFGISTLALVMDVLLAIPTLDPYDLFSAIVLSVFTAGGIVLLRKGSGNRKLIRHFQKLCSVLGMREFISIEELTNSLQCQKQELLPELNRMMEKSMLRQGHLDEAGSCLMVTNQSYAQYQELVAHQNQLKAEKANAEKELEACGIPPEYRNMMTECEGYLQKIHQCNDDLPGEVISAKLSRLELVVSRILKEVKKQPAKAAKLRQFMNYYMPTTWKLLDAYRSFEQEPIESDSIVKTKKEIEKAIDTINDAFEKLLDDLLQTTAWDISSDISVLQTMLAQEGLTSELKKS